MSKFISILIFILTSNSFAHIGHKAFFTFSEKAEKLQLVVKFKIFDLKEELKTKDSCSDSSELFWCIEKYLENNFASFASEVKIEFKNMAIVEKNDYLILNFDSNLLVKEIIELKIENTCFNTYDENYSNIIRFNLRNEDLTYKMTDKRTKIIHKFRSEK
ncbi:MAG: hypothetical protein DWQ06_12275 [Calditrichaeota bacterium]|nr:MAG: hypothetical protein DWQ06_12275 [Calditrichota bacterium]